MRLIVFFAMLVAIFVLVYIKANEHDSSVQEQPGIAPVSVAQSAANALFQISGELLPQDESFGCETGQTIGEYLALLVDVGSHGAAHEITFLCSDKLTPIFIHKLRDGHFYCEFKAKSVDPDEESPWQYSLIFGYSPKTGILQNSIRCPGSP